MEGEEEERRQDPPESVTGKLLRELHVMHRGMLEGFTESSGREEGEVSVGAGECSEVGGR